MNLDGLGGRRGQEVDDGFVVDFDVGAPEEVFAGCVFDVGEDVLHSSGDDTGLFVVPRLETGKRLVPLYASVGGSNSPK